MVALQTINSIFNYYDAVRQKEFPGPHAAELHKIWNQLLEEEIVKVKMCNYGQWHSNTHLLLLKMLRKKLVV